MDHLMSDEEITAAANACADRALAKYDKNSDGTICRNEGEEMYEFFAEYILEQVKVKID